MSKIAPLDERVREYMESLGFCKFHRDLTGEDGFIRKGPSGPFISDEIAEIAYLASLQARKDERQKCTDDTHPLYRGSIRSFTNEPRDLGWNEGTLHMLKIVDEKHEKRIAELDKLMETDQPNTTQGGDNRYEQKN